MHQVRQPAVAGAFYPGQRSTLSNDVTAMLAQAALAYARLKAACPVHRVLVQGLAVAGRFGARRIPTTLNTVRR